MMAQEINGHIVEIWASDEASEKPMIRIDGVDLGELHFINSFLSCAGITFCI